MPVPKKKTSKRKRDQRRANWKAIRENIVSCSNCGSPTLSHLACSECGYYNGREYLKAIPRRKRKEEPVS